MLILTIVASSKRNVANFPIACSGVCQNLDVVSCEFTKLLELECKEIMRLCFGLLITLVSCLVVGYAITPYFTVTRLFGNWLPADLYNRLQDLRGDVIRWFRGN